jgi:hypothetical protein
MSATTRLKFCLLTCALMGILLGDVHLWQFNYDKPRTIDYTYRQNEYNCLTKNNGSHAVAVTEYDNASKAWLSIVSERQDSGGNSLGGYAYEWKDWGFLWPERGWYGWQYENTDPNFPRSFELNNNGNHHSPRNVEVAIDSSNKLWGGVFTGAGFSGGGLPTTGAGTLKTSQRIAART